MNDKIQPILVIIATLGTIIFNYFAATGKLGGVLTNVVSDKNPTFITPAGYAFSIWSLIYLGSIAFSIYQFLPSQLERFRGIRRDYLITCVLNCAWLYFWSLEMVGVCVALIILLLATLGFINTKLIKTETNGEYWFAKGTFGIYFGWVTAATILNISIWLVTLGVKVADSTAILIGAGLLLFAGALAVFVRIQLTNYFYPLAVAWALVAIAVKQSSKTLIVAAAAVALIACLIASATFIFSMPSSLNKPETNA
ncbi:MAG TPA: tryptophan-rich sensory protein [Pyrinomonadaceae bacterium]|nr:tryptophan-rich sensory protein [Pyrinomonadaceae bacterium]